MEERVHSQNEVVIEIVGDAASRYARASHFTIVEGILLPKWLFTPLQDRLRSAGLVVVTTILAAARGELFAPPGPSIEAP